MHLPPAPGAPEPSLNHHLTVKEKNPLKSSPKKSDEGFASFWAIYPRHVAKAAAVSAWEKALRRADAATIVAGAGRAADAMNGTDRSFIPHPATWLNRDQWLDDPGDASNRRLTSAENLDRLTRPADHLGDLFPPQLRIAK
jgi:hypothetical protein